MAHRYLGAVLLLVGGCLGAAEAPYAVVTRLPVPGDGRWDYCLVAPDGHALYLPRSTHTQIVDPATGAVLHDLLPTPGVHGVALVPALERGFTSNGGDGTLTVFHTRTGSILGTVHGVEDADGILAEPATQQILTCCGDADALVSVPWNLDPSSPPAPVRTPLGGKPEAAAADGHGLVYVNLVDRAAVAVVDARTHAVTATWSIAPGAQPTGLGYDPVTHLLFVGCRNHRLVVLDATHGTVITQLPIGAGVDACAVRGAEAFASCGDGTLTVVHIDGPAAVHVAQVVPTDVGARTLAVDPTSDAIYLPTAQVAPGTTTGPHHRPTYVPGTFHVVVVRHQPAMAAAPAGHP